MMNTVSDDNIIPEEEQDASSEPIEEVTESEIETPAAGEESTADKEVQIDAADEVEAIEEEVEVSEREQKEAKEDEDDVHADKVDNVIDIKSAEDEASSKDLEEDNDEKPKELRLDLYIEALIFAAEYALNVEEIRKTVNLTFDQKFKKQHIQELIDNIRDKYEDPNLAIQLTGIAGGFLFMTKAKYHRIIGDFLKHNSRKKLSKAALETLSIIAYKQPISKSEIESIRGVNADYAVQKLLEKELVEITGRAEGPGRPLLYGTSTKFLNHFGISGTGDLPKLKEFETPEDTIGVSEEE